MCSRIIIKQRQRYQHLAVTWISQSCPLWHIENGQVHVPIEPLTEVKSRSLIERVRWHTHVNAVIRIYIAMTDTLRSAQPTRTVTTHWPPVTVTTESDARNICTSTQLCALTQHHRTYCVDHIISVLSSPPPPPPLPTYPTPLSSPPSHLSLSLSHTHIRTRARTHAMTHTHIR